METGEWGRHRRRVDPGPGHLERGDRPERRLGKRPGRALHRRPGQGLADQIAQLLPREWGGGGEAAGRAWMRAGRITEFSRSGAGAVWQRARFGTVRPRVQIPGPRPAPVTAVSRTEL